MRFPILLASVAAPLIACSSGLDEGRAVPVYASCSNSCTELKFVNQDSTGGVYVTIASTGVPEQSFGPLNTDGTPYVVHTDVAVGQTFDISAGLDKPGGTAVSCTVGAAMLPGGAGFGTVVITTTETAAATRCVSGVTGHWQ